MAKILALLAIFAFCNSYGFSQDRTNEKFVKTDLSVKNTSDISGKWLMTAHDGQQKIEAELEISQKDKTFNGKITSDFGNGVIENGTISGDELSATIKAEVQNQTMVFTMNGKLANDKIAGNLSGKDLPTVSFNAEKLSAKAADIAGDWTLKADGGGQLVTIDANFSQTNDKFTGTMKSQYGDGTFENGTVRNSKIKATLKAAVMGQDMILEMNAVITGDKIEGTLVGNNLEVPFTGTKKK